MGEGGAATVSVSAVRPTGLGWVDPSVGFSPENVEAARAVGMGGHHFQGDYAALEADLRAAGYDWAAS